MRELILDTINVLKEQVRCNLEEIKKNEEALKILMNEKESNLSISSAQSLLDQNKILLAQNFDFINLQLSLLKVNQINMSENMDAEDSENESKAENKKTVKAENTIVDFFADTIAGKMVYDENHPLFHDEHFFNRLMTYFQSIEQYEKCSELLKTKESKL